MLADRVRRASELIKLCRGRITRAQDDVARIVADLEEFDPDDDPAEPRSDARGRVGQAGSRWATAWARASSQGQLTA